jgi:hypothetical protein
MPHPIAFSAVFTGLVAGLEHIEKLRKRGSKIELFAAFHPA